MYFSAGEGIAEPRSCSRATSSILSLTEFLHLTILMPEVLFDERSSASALPQTFAE